MRLRFRATDFQIQVALAHSLLVPAGAFSMTCWQRILGFEVIGLAASWDVLPLPPDFNYHAVNPPTCATNVASAFNDVVGFAASVVNSVSDCGPDFDDFRCARTIVGMIGWVTHCGKRLSAATFNCGNVDSSCSQLVFSVLDKLDGIGRKIFSIISYCPSGSPRTNGLYCASSIINIVDKVVTLSMTLYTADRRCAIQEEELAREDAGGNDTNTTRGEEECLPDGDVCWVDEDCCGGRCALDRLCANASTLVETAGAPPAPVERRLQERRALRLSPAVHRVVSPDSSGGMPGQLPLRY